MNNPLKDPKLIAGIVAGGAIGTAGGFMTTGEKLEDEDASLTKQFTGSVAGGAKYGLIGAGIGGAGAGTVMALKKILGK